MQRCREVPTCRGYEGYHFDPLAEGIVRGGSTEGIRAARCISDDDSELAARGHLAS